MTAKVEAGKVSTIIPVFNRPQLLAEAVESVLNQSYRPIEIIIVDDGSTDDTSHVALGLAGRYSAEIVYIRQNNLGPGLAREAGRKRANGEFIQYLDSDDVLLANKFEGQVLGLRTNDCYAASYGKTRHYRMGDPPSNIAYKRTGEKMDTMFPALLHSRWWSTSTPLFKRSICDQAGAWLNLRNEEDWEYECRIAALGGKLHFCDQFVSDTRDHVGERLSHHGSTLRGKLQDRARAHQLIYGHADRAGVEKTTPEMQHFARELFLLSRQCGQAGLVTQARQLFHLAREASGQRGKGADFVIYGMLSRCLGWSRMGALSGKFDALRSRFRRTLGTGKVT